MAVFTIGSQVIDACDNQLATVTAINTSGTQPTYSIRDTWGDITIDVPHSDLTHA